MWRHTDLHAGCRRGSVYRRYRALLLFVLSLAGIAPDIGLAAPTFHPAGTRVAAQSPSTITTDILENGGFEIEHMFADDPLQDFRWNLGGVTALTVADEDGPYVAAANSFPKPFRAGFLDFAPHAGEYLLLFGTNKPQESIFGFERMWITQHRAWQYLQIPNAERATLRFVHQIVSTRTCGTDFAHVKVRELMQPWATLATIDICQPNGLQGWKEVNVDLSPYTGKRIFVQLEATIRDAVDTSAWAVDSAELLVESAEVAAAPGDHPLYLPAVSRADTPAPFVFTCKPSNGSGGRQPGLYETELAGLPAALYVGKRYDPTKPTFLTFYVHGDEGDYQTLAMRPLIRKLMDEQGWIHVGVKAPNLYGESYISWKEGDFEQKARMLAAAFDELFAQYNLCQGLLLGAGASGGSTMFTRIFIPLLSERYPSYFVANCGGLYPPESVLSSTDTDDLLAIYGRTPEIAGRIGIVFMYSDNDFVAEEVKRAIDGYRINGIQTEVIKTDSPGHCGTFVEPTVLSHWPVAAARVVR